MKYDEHSEIRIRHLEEGDVGALAAIEAESFSMPWSAEDFLRMTKEADALYLVAELGCEIAGSAGMRMVCGEGYIDNVVVAPAHRRRGIGKLLIEALLREGAALGCEAFTLEVRAGNEAAIALYEGAGFVSAGIRPGFYEKPVEDAVIYWKR